MAKAVCIENVKNKGGVICTDSFCAEIQGEIDQWCHDARREDWTPIPEYDPNLNGPEKGGKCYCCCSCFAYDTPIEVTPGEFALVQNIETGDTVLAAGLDLDWRPKQVEMATGWYSETKLVTMYYVRYEFPDGPESQRDILVTADHLFLMASNRLKAVQDLVPGDRIRRADGQEAEVTFVAVGSYVGGIRSLQMGEFDGLNLDGHLLNANGIVSADYAVQVYYASEHLPPDFLEEVADGAPRVGEPEYKAIYTNPAYEAFAADPETWPAGFSLVRRSAVTPPPSAKSFLTEAQALDVQANAPHSGESNPNPAENVLYLFDITRAFFPNTTLLLDWEENLPNAYAWDAWGQQMIVITGGLARITTLRRDGLALILSTMLAYRYPDIVCMGDADYKGPFLILREMWQDDLYFDVMDNALPQISELFDYIAPDHRGGQPGKICIVPSTECRMKTYQAAYSMLGLPDCAKTPVTEPFELKQARALSLSQVAVTFSRPVNPPTAESAENYLLQPQATVTAARLNPNNASRIDLDVEGLAATTSYLLTVKDVLSEDNVPIDPQHDTATFKTPKA
jgi:hypothetical protein